MRAPSKGRLLLCLLGVIALLAGAGLGSRLRIPFRAGEGNGPALLRLAGAFRVFVTDALWLQMRAHQSEGREDLVLADARTLLRLDPEDDRAGAFLHWHLAFNMAAKALDEEERRAWMTEGLDIADQGLARNPDSFDLNREVGLSLFTRSACNTDSRDGAARAFRTLCRERYGAPPVLLAPRFLERAFRSRPDDDLRLFLLAALANAAYYETARGGYRRAATLWEKLVRFLPLPSQGREKEKAGADLRRYYEALRAWCLRRAETGPGTGKQGKERTTAVPEEILNSPFYEDWNRFYEAWKDEEKVRTGR